MQLRKIKKHVSKGFALLEALISILLFSICIVGLLNLQAVLTENTYQAKYKGEAIELAGQLITQIMLDKNHLADYTTGSAKVTAWENAVKFKLPNAETAVVPDGGTGITITINWMSPTERSKIGGVPANIDKHQYSVTTYIAY